MSGSLFNLFGPTDAQNAIAAGNWTDPAALQAYRQQDLGNLAYQIGRASQQGLGPGTLFGMFGGGWAGAGVPGTQGAMAEKAKMDLNQAQALLAGQQAYAVPSEIELRQAQTQQALFNMWMARERLRLAQQPMPGDEGSSGSSGAPAASDGTYRGTLASSESGGNFSAKPNEGGYAGGYQFGAPRLQDLGFYTAGKDEDWNAGKNRWSGTFNIPDMPNIKTLDDFLASPEAQHKAQAASELNTEKFIFSNGLDKYIGQTINGTPITYNGMQAVAHLGGNAGLARYLTSNGDYNPADARGTKLSDYMGKFATVGVAPGLSQPQRTLVAGPGASSAGAPVPDASRPPPTAAGAPPPPPLNPNQATIAAPPTPPPAQLETAPTASAAYQRAKATGKPVAIDSTPGYAATPAGDVVPVAQAAAATQPPAQPPAQPPPQPPAVSAAPQGPSLTLPGGIQLTPQTAYQQYRQLMDLARRSELSGINMYGDPAALRQSAQKFLDYAIKPSQAAAEEAAKAGVELQTKPLIAAETKKAEAPYNISALRPGSIAVDANGKTIAFAPLQSEEMLSDGTTVTVFRNPTDGSVIGQKPSTGQEQTVPPVQVGSSKSPAEQIGASPLPLGAIVKKLPPAELERQTAGAQQREAASEKDYERDQGDAGHLYDQGSEIQRQMIAQLQMRDLVSKLPQTGAVGTLRADVASGLQTFLTPFMGADGAAAFVKRVPWMPAPDLAQELAKLTTQTAGIQEKGSVGARGSLGLTELFLKNNPGLNTLPDANKMMTGLLLAQNQMNLDYIRGFHDYVAQHGPEYRAGKGYTPASEGFDRDWLNQNNQQLYAAAGSALGGRGWADWTKFLGKEGTDEFKKNVAAVRAIVSRIDSHAQVMTPDGLRFVTGE